MTVCGAVLTDGRRRRRRQRWYWRRCRSRERSSSRASQSQVAVQLGLAGFDPLTLRGRAWPSWLWWWGGHGRGKPSWGFVVGVILAPSCVSPFIDSEHTNATNPKGPKGKMKVHAQARSGRSLPITLSSHFLSLVLSLPCPLSASLSEPTRQAAALGSEREERPQ